MKLHYFLLLFIPVFIFSCKKRQDEQLPVIEIQSPANGFNANVYDTLHVRIHLSDNMHLENMNVRLVTTHLIPVLPAVSVPVEGKSYDAVFDYVISNSRIVSGNYYLSVDVSDGYNTARSYSNIYVTGIPRALNGFFAATIPSPGLLSVYKGDTSWTSSLFTSYNSDFTDLAVNNYWQQVYTNGVYNGPLKATSIDGMTAGYSKNGISGPNPYWGMMSVGGSRLWVSYRADGLIKSFDQTGSQTFSSAVDAGFYSSQLLQVGDTLYTEQRDLSSSAVRMVVYNTTGSAIQESPLSVNAVAMFEKDPLIVYVLGNSGAQGHLLVYDFTSNGTWEPVSLPAGTVTCATQVDSNTLLIAMSDGNIYRFTYSPVGILTWASGINPSVLRYDDVNAEIYSAEGSNVKVYSYNPFALQHTVSIPYSISDLELWFNQ
jgi:hypothetical protein